MPDKAKRKSGRNARKFRISEDVEEQLQFYHAEPLDVAADLIGRRPNAKQMQLIGDGHDRAERSLVLGKGRRAA